MYKKEPTYLLDCVITDTPIDTLEMTSWNMRDRIIAMLDLFPNVAVTITRKPEETP